MSSDIKSDGPETGKKSNALSLQAIGLAVALLTAILTGAVSYAYSVMNDIRKGRLDFVNAQIEKLYGPLYASTQASDAIWQLFIKQQWRNLEGSESSAFFDDSNPPTPEQVRRWRHWMRTVFQPLNLKIEEAITTNSHLIVGDMFPAVFRDMVAHAEAYKAVMAAWADDDLKSCIAPEASSPKPALCPALTALRNTALKLNYPERMPACVTETYVMLKQRQRLLQTGFVTTFFADPVAPSISCGERPS